MHVSQFNISADARIWYGSAASASPEGRAYLSDQLPAATTQAPLVTSYIARKRRQYSSSRHPRRRQPPPFGVLPIGWCPQVAGLLMLGVRPVVLRRGQLEISGSLSLQPRNQLPNMALNCRALATANDVGKHELYYMPIYAAERMTEN